MEIRKESFVPLQFRLYDLLQECKVAKQKVWRCDDQSAKMQLRKGEDAEARNCKREGAIEHVISLVRLRSFASFTLVVFLNSLLLSVRMNYLFCSKLFQACFSVFYSSFYPVNISAKKSWNSHGPCNLSLHLNFYNSQFRFRLHISGLYWLILFFKWNDIPRIVSFLRTCWNP